MHNKLCWINKKELVKILEEAPGVKIIVKEIGGYMPHKLNLSYLESIIEELWDVYNEKEKIIQEARQIILAKTMNEFRNIKTEKIAVLAERVEGVCGIVISWFKYYYKSFVFFILLNLFYI